MSNPFALLDLDDQQTQKRSNNKTTQTGPVLTPLERKQQKEQKQAKQQQVQEDVTAFNFVKFDGDLSGFVEVDSKTTTGDSDKKLSKDDFLARQDRGELSKNKGGKKTGGNQTGTKTSNRGNQTGNRGGKQTGNQGPRQGGNQGQRQGNPQQQNRGSKKDQAPKQGGNQGGKKTFEKKTEGKTYVKKNDRKSRNAPTNKEGKRGGNGQFNWDDDTGVLVTVTTGAVDQIVDVVPEEIAQDVVVVEAVDVWVHEEVDEENPNAKKVINPEVQRVGLSAYREAREQDELKAKELYEALSAKQRTLDVVIPSESNINKKGKNDVAAEDAFLFGSKTQQKKTKKTKAVTTGPQVNFQIKKHRGFQMPREPRKEGEEYEPRQFDNTNRENRGGNRGNRGGNNRNNNDNRTKTGGNNRNNNNNRGPRRNQIQQSAFPPLGGNVAPKEAKWVNDEQ